MQELESASERDDITPQILISLALFYCHFPFVVRGNVKTEAVFTVRGAELLDFLEWGQSDGKSQGQINGVVFG